jgi:hypothetical protein
MNDLKNSTLGERVLLGIIAGLFGVVGFYVGYEHLSHGVNPILIGLISAVVVMIGSMAAAFIVEELIRRIPSRNKQAEKDADAVSEPKVKAEKPVKEPKVKKEKAVKPSRFKKEKGAPVEETAKEEEKDFAPKPLPEAKEATVAKVEESTSNGQIKRMTLNPTLREQRLAREEAAAKVAAPTKPEVDVKEPKEDVTASPESDFDGWDEEPVVAKKPAFEAPKAPSRPVAPKPVEPAPATRAQAIIQEKARQAEEPQQESLSLKDFIKAHPELSARRMVKEYRLAGGTESTDNILDLMN